MPEVIINGPEGRLEARYMPAADPTAPLALILHPEPNRGGNMNNRVSLAMYKHFQDRGYHVMRFNFRGVGRSKGVYNNGEGELSDAATALDWIEAQCPNARACWVAGFSFGSWIGMQLMMALSRSRRRQQTKTSPFLRHAHHLASSSMVKLTVLFQLNPWPSLLTASKPRKALKLTFA